MTQVYASEGPERVEWIATTLEELKPEMSELVEASSSDPGLLNQEQADELEGLDRRFAGLLKVEWPNQTDANVALGLVALRNVQEAFFRIQTAVGCSSQIFGARMLISGSRRFLERPLRPTVAPSPKPAPASTW